MVDRYYRKIEDVENDIENAMQISSILLKLKGYDKKLEGLSKIGDNENNISSNLSQIGDNENNISTNLTKIGDYENNISTNLTKIGDNENNISSNLSKIGDNENNISSNLSKIGDNENNISSNLTKIGDNENNISSNLAKINDNENSISTNLEKIDNFTQYILKSGKDFEEKYIIKKQIFRFNKDKHFYTMFEKEIEYNFTKNSLLFVKNNTYYKYDNLSNDYYRLQHEYNIYDGDNLIHKYLFNKDTYYDENLDPILHTNEDFCICFKKNYKKIKIYLQLHRHNRHGVGNIDLEIDDNDNYINIDYLDRNNDNNEKIDTNTESISTNLEKINTNVADIPSNLAQISTNTRSISTNSRQISTNKNDILSNLGKINNITKTIMLKNIYFTNFDSKKDEVITRELLCFDNTSDRSRVATINYVNMEYNFKKDDFIEIDCKLMISHSSYDNAKNNLVLYYDLYNEKNSDKNKILFRELRRYNQFPLIVNKDRIITYTKICYKVKYDTSNIAFIVHIQSATKKMHLIVNHYIIQNGVNYISVKHYGKS